MFSISNNNVCIKDINIPLDIWLKWEPEFQFPYGASSFLYNPNVCFSLLDKDNISINKDTIWKEGDEYIKKYNIYKRYFNSYLKELEASSKLDEIQYKDLVMEFVSSSKKSRKLSKKFNILYENPEALYSFLRNKRDSLLQSSDWTMLCDSPLSSEEQSLMKAYRRALRDMMRLDINSITFPKYPIDK